MCAFGDCAENPWDADDFAGWADEYDPDVISVEEEVIGFVLA